MIDPRTPVLVGVGTAMRRGAPHDEVEPLDLMVEAARAAIDDALEGAAGGPLAPRVATVAVPVGNWSYADPARLVARAIGASSARTIRVEIGVPQCTPIRVAAEAIRAGEIDAAMVLGGEAKASQLRVQRAGGTPRETDDGAAVPDEVWSPQGEFMAQPEIDAGIWDPVAQYACIENALGAALGLDVDAQLDEVAALWARCSAVARADPDAAFPEPRDAAALRTAGPGNRPLAWPYAKWHSTQWAVDEAAALVLCSAELAVELGVPEQRWVIPSVLVESSSAVSLSRRAQLHRWPAMAVLGEAAAAHLGRPLDDVEHVELYSCFPSAVRVQQRELGLDPEGTPTVLGAMAFAGGPFNHFTYRATAAVARRLRRHPGQAGLVTTVSGLLTKPGLAVWSHVDGAPREGLFADLGELAAERTEVLDVVSHAQESATVATFTVTYDGDEPASAFVVADLDSGQRWVGTSADPALWAAGLAGRLIGARVRIDRHTCSL